MQLLENSLYTTPAERAALVDNKKLVMDALAFSLLGFLGAYQLAQNRSFLKTYERTEGQLRLSSIGDTNHDVSLSVKLAAEAGAIPQSAAMNVTKLLYKIKSKQLKGPLDEQLIRDLIKTVKFSSHRPDGMVYSVVEKFETGAIGLGELTRQLYNLSKIPKFKLVSGEFRQLIQKGQYQELFAKLPQVAVSPTVSAPTVPTPLAPTPAATVSAPVARVITPPQPVGQAKLTEKGFENTPESTLVPLFKQMVTETEWTNSVLRDKARQFLKKNNISLEIKPEYLVTSLYRPLLVYMLSQVHLKNYSWAGPLRTYPKWILQTTSSIGLVPQFRTLMYMMNFGMNQHLLEAGKFEEFNANMTLYWAGNAENYKVDDINPKFIEDVIKPRNFWPALKQSVGGRRPGDDFLITIDKIAEAIGHAGALDRSTGSQANLNFESWTILALCGTPAPIAAIAARNRWANGYQHADIVELFKKVAGLENSTISVVPQSNSNRGIVVHSSIESFKDNPNLDPEGLKLLDKIGVITFVAIQKSYEAVFSLIEKQLSGSNLSSASRMLLLFSASATDVFGDDDILKTERFTDWVVAGLESGKIPMSFFDLGSGRLPDSIYILFWNTWVQFVDKNLGKVTMYIWAHVAMLARQTSSLRAFDVDAEIETAFKKLHARWSGADIEEQLNAYQGAEFTNFFINMAVKTGMRMPSLTEKAWEEMFTRADVNGPFETLWNFNDDFANKLFASVRRWRPMLMSQRKGVRDTQLGFWLRTLPDKDHPLRPALKSFIDVGGSKLTEDQVSSEVRDVIFKAIDSLKTDPVSFSYNEYPFNDLPQWIDDRIRKVLLERAKTSTGLIAIHNAQKLMDPADFNEHVTKMSIQDFVKSSPVRTTSDAMALAAILNKIAHHPATFNSQVLLRFAYALHLNAKESKQALGSYLNSGYESIVEALNSMVASGKDAEADQVYDTLSFAPDLRNRILDWFRKAAVLKNAIDAVKGDQIHALVPVDQKRMNQLMKYNNITFPTIRKSKSTKISEIIKTTTTDGTFALTSLATKDESLDDKALDRRTAEFDVFNKYRHGNIGLKFLKSFDVAIPSQIAANTVWNDAHPKSEVMDPVFHGTGSVAATFVLRYGFAVINASDASVVGRMLGNGIYFSNVLDKAGQYISDGGYSRGIGNKGYLFQMRANLGSRDHDYRVGEGNLVSPEWVVFHPNDQLNIYKAHFVELVKKSDVDAIKAKVKLNEDFFKVEQFKDYLREDLQKPLEKGCVSYTFMNGQIPITSDLVVDFEEFDPTAYGSHVTMAPSGLGPVVYIQVDDSSVNEVYVIRHTVQFMASQPDDFGRFLDLLSSPNR